MLALKNKVNQDYIVSSCWGLTRYLFLEKVLTIGLIFFLSETWTQPMCAVRLSKKLRLQSTVKNWQWWRCSYYGNWQTVPNRCGSCREGTVASDSTGGCCCDKPVRHCLYREADVLKRWEIPPDSCSPKIQVCGARSTDVLEKFNHRCSSRSETKCARLDDTRFYRQNTFPVAQPTASEWEIEVKNLH